MDRRHASHVLRTMWSAAASPLPVVIIGGGRWARVWLSVLYNARGGAHGIVTVARTNPDDLRNWLGEHPHLSAVHVAESLADAMEAQPCTAAAIVATRPRNHFRDAKMALDHDLHLLVEKPLTDQAADGLTLIQLAKERRRILLPGTEFAYLPAFHACVDYLRRRGVALNSIRIEWVDPIGEVRHGAQKAIHSEIGPAIDILPHAISIFSVFSPTARFHLRQANQDAEDASAFVALEDESGVHYELACMSRGQRRVRRLCASADGIEAVIDFSTSMPTLTINGASRNLAPWAAAMPSTLRLQLGAFLSEIATGQRTAFIPDASRLVSLQHQLEVHLSTR